MRFPSGLIWMSLIGFGLVSDLTAQATPDLAVRERSRSVAPGEVVRLTLTATGALAQVEAASAGRSIGFYRVDEGRTWEALVGIDVMLPAGQQLVEITAFGADASPRRLSHVLSIRPKVFPSRRITVSRKYAEPPPSVVERIRREAERLAAIFSASTPERLWREPFARPVRGRQTSVFGRRSIVNGDPQDPHRGADFRAPLGTTVRSPNAGLVVLAEDLYFAGRTVIVDHGLGLYSLLAHLSVIGVKEGARLGRGDIVGRSGASGRVTGPHLHWAVRLNDASVDPMALVAVTAGR
jgi:murein DD-endopeptidase MepM/ murein hydrolase activator NlpD